MSKFTEFVEFAPPLGDLPAVADQAHVRVYKNGSRRWTVDLYWRGIVVGRKQWHTWDYARSYAVWWVNG